MSAPTVVLEWQFSPPDYFEEPIDISRDDYSMVIDSGKVEARIASAVYDANPSMRALLHERLNDRLLGVEFFSHRPYELSKPSITRVHPDGRRDVLVEATGGSLKLAIGPVDFQLIDKDGNVVSDSRLERIEKKKRLAELVSTYRANDGLLGSLLMSYDAAVRDPDNELVHLYEIREALAAKFGGERPTQSTLGISDSDWSRLGRLCNGEPLRQGRHRGENTGALRDATGAELAAARGIARIMVEAYLQHLENSSGAGAP